MNQKMEFEEKFVMKDDKKSSSIDLIRAAAGYGRLTIKYRSAPKELAAIEELWHAILKATDTSAIDWTEESEGNRSATPRNPRGEAESSPRKAVEQVNGLPEAQVGLETAEPSEGVSAPPEATGDALGPDCVAATLEAKPQPPGDDFPDTCVPYMVRAARDLGLDISLEIGNCIGISGSAEVREKNSRLIRWIEEHTALIAEMFAKQCRWCGEVGELKYDGLFCSGRCWYLAGQCGWQTEHDSADRAQGVR